MDKRNHKIALGKIVGIHGVRGWVKIYSDCRPRESIFNYKKLLIQTPQNQEIPLTLKSGQTQGKGLVASFEDINNRDDAAKLMGSKIYILKEQLPKLKKNEFYWQDLINLSVINRKNITLGTVYRIIETGANDVMIIKTVKNTEILIPFIIDYYVDKVDLKSGHLFVDWETDWNDVSDEE